MNAHFFEGKAYEQEKTSVNGFKFSILKIMLICALITISLIESNVLKYLDPGSGSVLIQTILGCSICGIPLAIIGAVVYFFTKNRKKNTQSDSTKESNS
jgi:hypothetical protein